jgi:dihydrodipicolinate synthase/N-acetylneuraminate lyase
VPKIAVRLFDLIHKEQDLEEAWVLYARMLPLLRYLEYEGKTQKALKYMLDQMGLCGGLSSSPKLPLSSEDKSKINRLMSNLGIQCAV